MHLIFAGGILEDLISYLAQHLFEKMEFFSEHRSQGVPGNNAEVM